MIETKNKSGLEEFLENPYGDEPVIQQSETFNEPLNGSVNSSACKWLDDYIEYSRKWSPRAFDDYHGACAIWILSSIAQRRVCVHLGKPKFGNLYICLVGHTTVTAKTHTADIAKQTLIDSGLGYLLAHDEATPQAFINYLSTPKYVKTDSVPDQNIDRLKQRGATSWYYDEFGTKIRNILKLNSVMSEFQTIFLKFDNCDDKYESATISRGIDKAENLYLSLLGTMTPINLQRAAAKNSEMWSDGFWARFALICPNRVDKPERLNVPDGDRIIPEHIRKPLKDWNKRLGWPDVDFIDCHNDEGEPNGLSEVDIEDKLPIVASMSEQAREAILDYEHQLATEAYMVYSDSDSGNKDMVGNLGRFPDKALRIALLLASLENNDRIELRHVQKGIEICGRWRKGLLAAYTQSNEKPTSDKREQEDKILRWIQKKGNPTAAIIANNIANMSTSDVMRILKSLVEAGIVTEYEEKRSKRYFETEDIRYKPILDRLGKTGKQKR